MKLIICAIAAAFVSLSHSLLKESHTIDQPAVLENSTPPESSEVITIFNHEGQGTFHMVARTSEDQAYQPWCSNDEVNWHKYGAPFEGNGSFRIVSVQEQSTGSSNQIFVKLERL